MSGKKGVLIECDVPTMQVIKFLNKQEQGNVIIRELDDTHVFVHKSFMPHILEKVEELQRKTHYT